jgi:hypothetical protein
MQCALAGVEGIELIHGELSEALERAPEPFEVLRRVSEVQT